MRGLQEDLSDADGAEVLVPLVDGDLDGVVETLGEPTVDLRQLFHVQED